MLENKNDTLDYIESAFLDKKSGKTPKSGGGGLELEVPSIGDYLRTPSLDGGNGEGARVSRRRGKGQRFRKTQLSAPRPRRVKGGAVVKPIVDTKMQATWSLLPKNLDFLLGFFDDSVTSNYYRGDFKESREQLIRRLLDPVLNLEDTSRLLGVCPATVRRYTNRGWLGHHRTKGGQRRFRLSDVVGFVESHGRFPEE